MTMTRRSLLAVPAMSAGSLGMAAAGSPVRFGGPIYLKSDDPAALAKEHRRLGYSAGYCPAVKLEEKEKIAAIEKAFAAENVVIAEVGAWVNLLDPNTIKRAENLKYVTDRLALAEAVGARCCVDIAGSYNEKIWFGPHPKNLSQEFFDATVETTRKIIDAVKPKRTKYSVEMMGWALPDSPDSYVRLFKAVDRPTFGVHLDPCNIVNSPERFYSNSALISECFRKLGRWIVSCHAKDLDWSVEMNVHFREVIPGKGEVDYRTYLRELSAVASGPPLMLEHLKTAEDYAEGAAYIRKIAGEVGVTFA
jgi:sugar phosphate isomerase/epimerase